MSVCLILTRNMHLAMCIILELEPMHNPHRVAEHASSKAIATEQSLMASPRNPKLNIKIWAVGLAGIQAWQCDRAPRIDQNINVQLFGILFSRSWVLPSVPDSRHSLPVPLIGFSQQYLHTSEITSAFSLTVLLLQITPVLTELIVNCGIQQARWRILL